MIRRFLVSLVLLAYVTTQSNAGIVIDFDKKLCESNCGTDMECKLALKVCEYSMTTMVDTVESEVIKRLTQYAGSALAKTGTLLVKVGVYKSKEEAYKVLGNNVIYFGNIFAKNGGILVPDKKVFSIDAMSMVTFALDATLDIIFNEVIDHLSHEVLSTVRSVPGIHDNAPDDTIRQALKWMVKLAMNDLKATIYYGMGKYIDAAGAGVVDNALLLGDIALKTATAADDFFDSKTALNMSRRRGEILDLYWKTGGPYFRLRETEESESKLKKEVLADFLTDCKKIQLDLGQFVTANWSKINQGYGAKLNQELKNRCTDYYFELQKTNSQKKYILSNALTNYTRDRYNKMIEYYFHQEDWDYYKKLYDITNYNPQIGFSKNSAEYKYVKKLYLYGVNYESRFANPSSKDASIFNATIGISNVLLKYYGTKKSIAKIAEDAGYTLKTKLTRKVYGQLIYANFNIKHVGFDKNQMATFKQLEGKRSSAEATLAALEIIPGYRSDSKYNLFSNKAVKSFTLVQMLADTLDVVTCGHKGCSYEEIIKGGN